MIERIKQIKFKSPRYQIPIIAYVPFMFACYGFNGLSTLELEDDKRTSVEGAVNTEMPDPNMDNLALKSKYANMVDNFRKDSEYSAVMKLDEELQVLDSLEERRNADIKILADLQRDVESDIAGRSTAVSEKVDNNDEMIKQMELIQKIANGEKILTPEQEEEQRFQERLKKLKEEELAQKKLDDAPEFAQRVHSPLKKHFNTICSQEDADNNYIKAMLDEKIKVVDGSRIRIRLLDDIMIDEVILSKGTYLYATISGFGNQRVKAVVENVIVGGETMKVSLRIYDNDGLEGFYVPDSAFRDLTKDASSQAVSQNITMNSSSDQDLEAFALQTLQSIYSSTTSALSKSIKKNRAKLKYNTVVYLINE